MKYGLVAKKWKKREVKCIEWLAGWLDLDACEVMIQRDLDLERREKVLRKQR